MGGAEKAKSNLKIKYLLFLAASVLANSILNIYAAAGILIPHLDYFATSPGKDYEEHCPRFMPLMGEIGTFHHFIGPSFASYWLWDIVSDILLWRSIITGDWSWIMTLLKSMNLLPLFLFVCYYSISVRVPDVLIAIGISLNLLLKFTGVFLKLVNECNRYVKDQNEKRVKKNEYIAMEPEKKKVVSEEEKSECAGHEKIGTRGKKKVGFETLHRF